MSFSTFLSTPSIVQQLLRGTTTKSLSNFGESSQEVGGYYSLSKKDVILFFFQLLTSSKGG